MRSWVSLATSAEEDGKLYVSSYGGYVSRFDAKTLALEASVKVDANPEELVEEDDVIYVVCSGYGAGKTLCTINTKIFDKAESIEIVNNPQRIVESDDHIYVLAGSPSYNPANYDYSQQLSILTILRPRSAIILPALPR